jgi:peptidoglycan/LPS O-acetylase OafA/YrhL
VLIAAAISVLGARASLPFEGADAADGITFLALVKAATLATYVSVPQVIVLGVAWTLVIEIVFYALLLAASPLLKSRLPDWVATAAILGVVVLFGLLARSFGPGFFLLSVSVSYVPLLLLGHVVYLVHQRGLDWRLGVGLGGAAWVVFVWGIERTQPLFLTPEQSYGSSVSVALLLVLGALVLEGKVRMWRPMDIVAKRSYSLYLVHGPIGLSVLAVLWAEGVAYRWALVAALAAVAIGTEVLYRTLERPSITWARALTTSKVPPPGPAPVEPPPDQAPALAPAEQQGVASRV